MKKYPYYLIILLSIWFLITTASSPNIDELLTNFLIYLVSIILVLIATFLNIFDENK